MEQLSIVKEGFAFAKIKPILLLQIIIALIVALIILDASVKITPILIAIHIPANQVSFHSFRLL